MSDRQKIMSDLEGLGLAMVAAGQNDIRFKWGETIRYSPSEVEKILSATEDVGCLIVKR